MPEFSIIIPCYNQARFLPTALESALAQRADVDVEIIAVDDGSPDDSAEIASRYEGVTVIRQANAGLCGARNTGIAHASGTYLLFLDSDDALRPGMLAAAARAFEQDPSADVVHGLADVVDEEGKAVVGEFGGADLSVDPFHRLLRSNIGPPNTFVVRRETLQRVGVFDVSLRSCEDWDLWLRMAAAGARFRFASEMRSVYRVVAGSMSKNVEPMWRNGRRVLLRSHCLRPACPDCGHARSAGMGGLALSMRPLFRDLVRSPGGPKKALGILLRNPSLLGWQLYWQMRSSLG
ncbi:glycosyltransferase [Variovorax dokdonensis]|uniref:Glycosyltransferase n=1 Tax=Variovorax dokdonensis TaxID=344883 RepID=A0ABT7N5N0_9BURK|nr:glycosyltransferase [Variovorax dokdonensis]MDM0043230.1 glycosyltransferase [Variovorax dokdonensis]